jgi:hypothetical protein
MRAAKKIWLSSLLFICIYNASAQAIFSFPQRKVVPVNYFFNLSRVLPKSILPTYNLQIIRPLSLVNISERTSTLPLFCAAEHMIFKSSGINFRFRLGSVDYVNYLESKPGYHHLVK